MFDNFNKIDWQIEKLKQGCILASIAHAIMVAHYPDLSNEHSWDGINYNIQDSDGSRGTITFDSEYCIGAFRNDNSDRIEIINDAKNYFLDAPKEVIAIAESETLQYLLENLDGNIVPNITTAFWGFGNNIFTKDSLEEMYAKGGFLLEKQLMDLSSSIEYWVEYYDMSQKQCDLLKKIFDKKINSKSENIILSQEDVIKIGTSNIEGLKESRISFGEIGIIWDN